MVDHGVAPFLPTSDHPAHQTPQYGIVPVCEAVQPTRDGRPDADRAARPSRLPDRVPMWISTSLRIAGSFQALWASLPAGHRATSLAPRRHRWTQPPSGRASRPRGESWPKTGLTAWGKRLPAGLTGPLGPLGRCSATARPRLSRRARRGRAAAGVGSSARSRSSSPAADRVDHELVGAADGDEEDRIGVRRERGALGADLGGDRPQQLDIAARTARRCPATRAQRRRSRSRRRGRAGARA